MFYGCDRPGRLDQSTFWEKSTISLERRIEPGKIDATLFALELLVNDSRHLFLTVRGFPERIYC